MDLSDSGAAVNLVAGLVIAAGVLGVLLPVLPGLLLTWGGVLFWALLSDAGGPVRWLVLALATVIAGAGAVTKFLWPGRKLSDSGVPGPTLLAGGVTGLVGFFVVPVVGLVLGFLLGVYLVEAARLGAGRAWPSTRRALAAVGLSLLVELAAALGIAVVWVFGLILG
ncbi:DUF456 domain-containing protein [Actinoplanes teichomyceticus]|uniref:DUF456 domain-containing protein n=1 Tax=Actinoplanes teichomyceticus TaxID=1867 RepID=A0A561VRW1_ACTTI|nr:DUF456 domain-containing protein [Actinoplanes teichomyceticus]TWG14343.1 hypothetical protein FHX34_104643 [Actinoplanes teichomyceticus]GIF13099.1 hypothetical protein Ate01nite_31310 [Actinoplanes teichomyceticus]